MPQCYANVAINVRYTSQKPTHGRHTEQYNTLLSAWVKGGTYKFTRYMCAVMNAPAASYYIRFISYEVRRSGEWYAYQKCACNFVE